MTTVEPDTLAWEDDQGRFPRRNSPSSAAFQTANHATRAIAKRVAQTSHQHACLYNGWKCSQDIKTGHDDATISCQYSQNHHDAAGCRPHFEKYYSTVLANKKHRVVAEKRSRKRHRQTDNHEDIHLARSTMPLPYDRLRQHTPSLGRQDAFYDASTAKIRLQKQATSSEDAQIAQLYQHGLLYDSVDTTSTVVKTQEPLSLDSIAHAEPLYAIRIIPAKKPTTKTKPQGVEKLSLHLSFTNISDDQTILSLANTPLEEAIQHVSQASQRSGSPPMRVVYELGSPVSVDFDASQPPDLIYESIGDYDCISDLEMDDSIPSHETIDLASDDPWVILGDDS